MLYTKPSAGLASIFSAKTLRSKESFRKTVQRTVKDLPLNEARAVRRTMMKMNANPEGIAMGRITKQTLRAMGNAGLLKTKYQTNPGMAVSHMHQAAPSAASLTPAQSKEQERVDARKEARLQGLARDRREEAEGHLSEAEVHDHRPGDLHKSSLGMKEWQQAKVGIGQVVEEKDKINDQPDKPAPVVEMNIG